MGFCTFALTSWPEGDQKKVRNNKLLLITCTVLLIIPNVRADQSCNKYMYKVEKTQYELIFIILYVDAKLSYSQLAIQVGVNLI